MFEGISGWLVSRQSAEKKTQHIATELLIFLDSRDTDAVHADEDLRRKVRDAVTRWHDAPNMKPKEFGQRLMDIVFSHDPDPSLPQEVRRDLAQLHKKREISGHQLNWNGIMLVEVLRMIEKEAGVILFDHMNIGRPRPSSQF